ncbi:hypothetical protein [uncultured Pseudodesulfovibrio sp.]|uniref:hypothetical protein n=1 Tax=uncultured Pseudodesulfovibrio sp. TaxID=2035858 RepID=UPI0029C786A6|nr:hypothetical protein [uncultured Pseudodesulfovibrio sp.]
MKACILKPILYNPNNYTAPAGYHSGFGFVAENGFGFEEWNNNPAMTWQGRKLFHSEGINDASDFADGRLLMLMYANCRGQHAVGVAAGVFSTEKYRNEIIADVPFLYDRHRSAWQFAKSKGTFPTHDDFMSFWQGQYQYVNWCCLTELFFWFPAPVPINARDFIGSGELTNRYQKKIDVSVESVANFLQRNLPKVHPIWTWLSEDSFLVPKKGSRKDLAKGNPLKTEREKRRKGGGAVSRQIVYSVEGERTVHPYHAELQAAYVDHLKKKGITPRENENDIDIQYEDQAGNLIYCEVKPTKNVPSKYAIRASIGQLLEYRFNNDPRAELKVVINYKPLNQKEIELLHSLQIDLAYFDERQQAFVECGCPEKT